MTAPSWADVSRLLASAPGQFWNERPASEWSERETEQLLSRSPWAKEAEAQFKMPGGGGPRGGGPGGGADAPAGGERPDRPDPTAEQRKAMIGTLKQSSALQRKGKDPLAAVRVGELEGSETPTLLFYFPRTGDPISLADKEVIFRTRIGPLQLKVKFAV